MPTVRAFEGIVYHGAAEAIERFELREPARGIYFSGDPDYARDHGPHVHACRVRLARAAAYGEDEANADMEIDREALIALGYDGRIVEYGTGEIDVIAFHPGQVTLLEIVSGPGGPRP